MGLYLCKCGEFEKIIIIIYLCVQMYLYLYPGVCGNIFIYLKHYVIGTCRNVEMGNII